MNASTICNRTALLFALNSVSPLVSAAGKTLNIHNNIKFMSRDGFMEVHGSDETAIAVGRCPGDVQAGDFPDVLIPANFIDILNVWRGDEIHISFNVRQNRIDVSDGREKMSLAAIYEKQENHIAGQMVSFGPEAYRQIPSGDLVECGRMSSHLFSTIVSRVLVIRTGDVGFEQGASLRMSAQFPYLEVAAVSDGCWFYWQVRDKSVSFLNECSLIVPKKYLPNITTTGNDIVFGTKGSSFYISDSSGLVSFYCPQVAGSYPDMSRVVTLPHSTTIRVESRDVARFCSLSNSNFQKTVGEDRGRVSASRIRFNINDSKLVLDTGGDLGDLQSPVDVKEISGPDITMTFNGSLIAPVVKAFPGSVNIGLMADSLETMHMKVWGNEDSGKYVVAPLRGAWDD